MAEGDIASLGLRIDSSEVKKADADLEKLTRTSARAERATDDLKGSWEGYSKTLNRGISVMSVAARALPVIALGAAMKSMAAEGLRFGDQISKAAKAAGLAAGEFSQFAAVARSIGTDVPAVSAAFETLGRKISQSAAGNKEATRTLEQLGLSAQFLRRLNPGEQLEQVADALARLSSATDRQRLGNEVLGASYEQLVPILAEGASGLQRLRKEQEQLGNTLTDDQAKKLAAGQQSIRELSQAWSRFGTNLASFVAPAITAVLNTFNNAPSQESVDSLRARLRSIEHGYDEVAKAALRAQIAQAEAQRTGTGRGGRGRPGGGRGRGEGLDPAIIAEVTRELDRGTASGDRMAEAMRKASVSFDVAEIKRTLSLAASEYANYEDLLDAERRAGLMGEREYYAEKRALIEKNAAAQIAALQAESDRIRAERVSGPDLLEQQRKIADNETQIVIIRQRAATDVAILGKRQTAAMQEVARSYEDARVAAEGYLAMLNERWSREVSGMGLGRRQREMDSGRSDLDADFERQRQRLERDRQRGDITQEQYDQQLAIIREFHQKALAGYDSYWQALTDKQGSFFVGASEALRNFIDESRDVAGQTEQVFTRAFDGMADALTQFVMTGKGDFKSLAESIIADLIRIQMRTMLTQIFSGVLGGLFGGAGKLSGTSGVGTLTGATVGYAANGGDISGPTVVGERGPELIFPKRPMTVVPNHDIGGVNINTTINAAPGVNVAQMSALLDARDAQIKADVYQNMGRNRWRRVTG